MRTDEPEMRANWWLYEEEHMPERTPPGRNRERAGKARGSFREDPDFWEGY